MLRRERQKRTHTLKDFPTGHDISAPHPPVIIMDGSPVLRQQSQNKIQRGLQRMKNEQNKKPAKPKSSKLLSSPRLSKKDSENQNPGGSKIEKKAPARPVSRLPVLAKSLHLQAPSNFSQVHCSWEENPLVGKAKKKKTCTRPVPFNFSQPRVSRLATKRQQDVVKSHTDAQTTNNTCKNKPVQSKVVGKPTAKSHEVASLLEQSVPSSTLKTSDRKNMGHHKEASPSAVSAEVCVNDLNQLTLNDPPKISLTAPQTSPKEKRENFQCDHKALLSILKNEGVNVPGQTFATPHSKQLNSQPQRVSVMKSHRKTGGTAGPLRLVQFSPDPVALQSILLNEGLKAGGPVGGVTPRNSVCPPGRGTSIYTAQRVPVKKIFSELTDGPAAVAGRETPQNKWNPQRIRNTRNQPLSAQRWPQSPYNTPGIRSCKSKQLLEQEVVVQRLFADPEDKQSDEVPDKDNDTQAKPLQASESKVHCEEKGETSRTGSNKELQTFTGGKVFIQVPQRDSVIFFSTGTKLFRAPAENQENFPAPQDQPGPGSVDQRNPQTQEASEEATCQINPSEHLHRESPAQKTCSLSPPIAILRRRFLLLGEARLDDEVATFTSQPVPTHSRFLPPRPRCGNPLASVLHFNESTRFIPIGCPVSSDLSSPLHD